MLPNRDCGMDTCLLAEKSNVCSWYQCQEVSITAWQLPATYHLSNHSKWHSVIMCMVCVWMLMCHGEYEVHADSTGYSIVSSTVHFTHSRIPVGSKPLGLLDFRTSVWLHRISCSFTTKFHFELIFAQSLRIRLMCCIIIFCTDCPWPSTTTLSL